MGVQGGSWGLTPEICGRDRERTATVVRSGCAPRAAGLGPAEPRDARSPSGAGAGCPRAVPLDPVLSQGRTCRPPCRLTQKFALNSEPVMLARVGGAEESRCRRRERAERPACHSPGSGTTPEFHRSAGKPPPGPKPRPIPAARVRTLRSAPPRQLAPRT